MVANLSIDSSDHLVVDIPSGVGSLNVENGLASATQQFPAFSGTADLGTASAGIYTFLFTLNGIDSVSAVVSISGVPGQFALIVGSPEAATQGVSGFDTDASLTNAQISVLKTNFNYQFCLRYVSRGPASSSDISDVEVARLLTADIPLMIVQHPPIAPWVPTQGLGNTWGLSAVSNTKAAKLPKGITVFCDLEGVDDSVVSGDIIAFCNAWSAAVKLAGFIPGLYVGFDSGLDATEISALEFAVFWKSCSTVPIPSQGFSMTQGPCDVSRDNGNVSVVVDENHIDLASGSLVWLKKQ